MDTIGIINPNNGQTHYVPYDELGAAMEAGGQFSDESQKQKAIQIQKSMEAPEEKSELETRDENIRKTTGFKGLAAETLLNLSNAMKSSVLFGKDTPSMMKQAVAAEEERPLRPWIATAGGVGEIAKSAVNAPIDLMKFIARKEVLPEALNKYYSQIANSPLMPHIPQDTGIANLFGLDKEQPEDRFYKGLSNVLSMGIPSEISAIKGLEGGKVPKKILPKQVESQIEREKNLLDISGQRLDKFKQSLERDTGYRTSNSNTLVRNAGDMADKVSELKPIAEMADPEITEIPKAPETAKMKRAVNAEVDTAKENLSAALEEGKTHHVDAGEIFNDEIQGIKKAASDQYNKTNEYYADKTISIDKSAEIAKVKEKISTLHEHYKDIPGYETGTPDVVKLENDLKNLEKPESIKATDVLDTYQSLHKMAKNIHDEVYARGSNLTKDEIKAKKSAASKYESLAEDLADILSNVGDANGIKMLKDARAAWREYASLYGNPIFHSIERHGAIPSGTIDKLALGTKGNELLNKIVEKRPDLRQKIFAQKYSKPSSHNSLLRPNDINESNLNKLPEIKDLVDAFKIAAENKKDVHATAADLELEHKQLSDSIKAAATIEKYKQQIDKNIRAADILDRKMKEAKSRGENIKLLEKQHAELLEKNAKIKKLLKQAIQLVYRYGGIKAAFGH